MSTLPPQASSFMTGWDDGLGVRSILGEITPDNRLLRLIAERIRLAAAHLKLSRHDLNRIFARHSIFEGEAVTTVGGRRCRFLIVETHHLIQGKVGKGALKVLFPHDLLGQGGQFLEAADGAIEVRPPGGRDRWATAAEAEEVVKHALREFMTGESLSMSLKCQATGAPFAGSEGLVLCAAPAFDQSAGRYFLCSALQGTPESAGEDKELIERMMNLTAEVLTEAGRIAYNKIVHAAETNSTLTARLDLQLPTNVVEGHLRALLRHDPGIIIGDEDMTPRLRELLEQPGYSPTACALAREAAGMQMDHSILLLGSRDRLRRLLDALPGQGSPSPGQYRQVIDLFFGSGETQKKEEQLYHHREAILRPLAVALSIRCLEECGDPEVLKFYLKTLLDNQRIMMQATLLKRLWPGQALPVDWFDTGFLLSADAQQQLKALMLPADAGPEQVREAFRMTARILYEARAKISARATDSMWQARRELLDRAVRAITDRGEVMPSVDRILFFTLPYTYECVTPKLGVVTRKPVEVCGSVLRPEAMAVGAVMAIEILLKRLIDHPQPLNGMTVAIEGLGNAGKHVATLMLSKGATIVAVSDSKGALAQSGGFSREQVQAIIAHKNSGKRLDTFMPVAVAEPAETTAPTPVFHPDPEALKRLEADLLVLSAIPGSVHSQNAPELRVKVVCELTGAAVTSNAKRALKERQVQVIPDNLASSGGVLVSLSEMVQNSAGQNWQRPIEEQNLYEQLAQSFDAVLQLAAQYAVDVPTASDLLALRRMGELAIYRERLESVAAKLRERILSIQPREQVLIVSDDDEDGVASAAIMQGLIAALSPGVDHRLVYLNESFRSGAILELVKESERSDMPVRHVFVLDRAFPLSDPGQKIIAHVAQRCHTTLINNHDLPPWLSAPDKRTTGPALAGRPKAPADLGVLFISPQTLKAVIPAREFSTSMILKELAHQLMNDEQVLTRIDWQAAVGSWLDTPPDQASEWLLSYTQFSPDKTFEAARAVRTVTRAGGFMSAVHAVAGVLRPDQLETNEAWEQFMAEYHALDERVQVLVEKIALENRRRPYTAHFFTPDEVASPTPIAGNAAQELDFYHWISERLAKRGGLAEMPIIVGQVVRAGRGHEELGVRIRSPRGVNLMQVGLPEAFQTGGLPHTAIARLPLAAGVTPEQQFHELVEQIWQKTASPLYFSAPTPALEGTS